MYLFHNEICCYDDIRQQIEHKPSQTRYVIFIELTEHCVKHSVYIGNTRILIAKILKQNKSYMHIHAWTQKCTYAHQLPSTTLL